MPVQNSMLRCREIKTDHPCVGLTLSLSVATSLVCFASQASVHSKALTIPNIDFRSSLSPSLPLCSSCYTFFVLFFFCFCRERGSNFQTILIEHVPMSVWLQLELLEGKIRPPVSECNRTVKPCFFFHHPRIVRPWTGSVEAPRRTPAQN